MWSRAASALRAELRDHLAVHLHAALGDQLFRVAAAGDAGLREDLLQALELRRRAGSASNPIRLLGLGLRCILVGESSVGRATSQPSFQALRGDSVARLRLL